VLNVADIAALAKLHAQGLLQLSQETARSLHAAAWVQLIGHVSSGRLGRQPASQLHATLAPLLLGDGQPGAAAAPQMLSPPPALPAAAGAAAAVTPAAATAAASSRLAGVAAVVEHNLPKLRQLIVDRVRSWAQLTADGGALNTYFVQLQSELVRLEVQRQMALSAATVACCAAAKAAADAAAAGASAPVAAASGDSGARRLQRNLQICGQLEAQRVLLASQLDDAFVVLTAEMVSMAPYR
jgi:hypothetical protein